MRDVAKIIAERCVEARKRKQMSRLDLAYESGIAISKVGLIERQNGGKSLSHYHLRCLARALGVSIDYLVGKVDDPQKSLDEIQVLHTSRRRDDG